MANHEQDKWSAGTRLAQAAIATANGVSEKDKLDIRLARNEITAERADKIKSACVFAAHPLQDAALSLARLRYSAVLKHSHIHSSLTRYYSCCAPCQEQMGEARFLSCAGRGLV